MRCKVFGDSRQDLRVTKSNSFSLLSTLRSQEQDSSQMVFIATSGVIWWLIKQKSAEAIVAERLV